MYMQIQAFTHIYIYADCLQFMYCTKTIIRMTD